MTDRELLEKAARAAGIDVEMSRGRLVLRQSLSSERRIGSPWNPLTDDGDALRLAVKLRINLEHLRTLRTMQFNEVSASPFGRGDCMHIEETGTDPAAATRRAIVRAAAALGAQNADQG